MSSAELTAAATIRPSWAMAVAAEDVRDGSSYFLAHVRGGSGYEHYVFYARGLNGKAILSEKPGIALKHEGGSQLRDLLKRHPTLVAIAVPADAAKRWSARRRRI